MSNYPIVSMRRLSEPERTGFLKLKGPRRAADELPRPSQGHHVLVYRVNGRYVLDNVKLERSDDDVVRATQVTEVDMSRNMPVTVAYPINSKDHASFMVEVTFECTVVDPVVVVSEGITDPARQLLNYLKSHHNASQMGLDFTLAQIHEVRRYVDAQLTAFRTHRPPAIPGFEIRMSSVEVRTPHEEAEDANTRRTLTRQHNLTRDRLDMDSELDSERARHEQDRARRRMADEHDIKTRQGDFDFDLGRQRLDHQTDLDTARIRSDYGVRAARQDSESLLEIQRRKHERLMSWEQQAHDDDVRLAAQRAELERLDELETFRMRRLGEATEMIGADPDRALLFAYMSGKLEATEFAERLRGDRDEERIYVRAEADKDREERIALARNARDERLEERRYQRDEAVAKVDADRADLAWQRQEDRYHRESDREREEVQRQRDERREERARAQAEKEQDWRRQDELLERKVAYETARARREGQLQVMKDLINRGLLDASSINLEQMVAKLGGDDVITMLPPDAELDSVADAETVPPRGAAPETVDGAADA